MLNATRPIITCLVELGLLTPLHESSGRNTRDKCGFDALEADLVMKRIHDLAPGMSEMPIGWVTLIQCTKRARIPMQQLLQAILRGRIKGIGCAPGEVGFSALRIDIEEIRRMTLGSPGELQQNSHGRHLAAIFFDIRWQFWPPI